MSIETKLRRLAAELDDALPYGHSVELNVRRYAHPPDAQIAIHGVETYAEAQLIFRDLGIAKRNKSTWSDTPQGRTVLEGKLGTGLEIKVFCNELPPACRLETYTERIPKTQVLETPCEGEFIEVQRSRVVCGGHSLDTETINTPNREHQTTP